MEKTIATRLRQVGNAIVIDLIGDVTDRGQKAIADAYAEALANEPEQILFNFGETEYINTSGIAILISIVMEAKKTGHKIGLFGMSEHYRKVFTLVRLPLYAELFESETEALTSL